METIKSEKLKIKPKWFFYLGSLLGLAGLISAVILSAFFISIISFSLRPHYGPGASFRLQLMWDSFPWWAVVSALIGLIVGIKMLKKYDFSYQKNFGLIIICLIAAIILAGILMDQSGLTDLWTKKGPMRGIMRQYLQQKGEVKGVGRGRMFNQ